jgi:hypothetical protein
MLFCSSGSQLVHARENAIVGSVYIKGLPHSASIAPYHAIPQCEKCENVCSPPLESLWEALLKSSPAADASELQLSTMSCFFFRLLLPHKSLIISSSLKDTIAFQLRGGLGREIHAVQCGPLSLVPD